MSAGAVGAVVLAGCAMPERGTAVQLGRTTQASMTSNGFISITPNLNRPSRSSASPRACR
jgi:hypothetical protein